MADYRDYDAEERADKRRAEEDARLIQQFRAAGVTITNERLFLQTLRAATRSRY